MLVDFAPLKLPNVVPPSALTCHCTVGAGDPLAEAVKVALLPAATVWSTGLPITAGAVLVLPPPPATTPLQEANTRLVAINEQQHRILCSDCIRFNRMALDLIIPKSHAEPCGDNCARTHLECAWPACLLVGELGKRQAGGFCFSAVSLSTIFLYAHAAFGQADFRHRGLSSPDYFSDNEASRPEGQSRRARSFLTRSSLCLRSRAGSTGRCNTTWYKSFP